MTGFCSPILPRGLPQPSPEQPSLVKPLPDEPFPMRSNEWMRRRLGSVPVPRPHADNIGKGPDRFWQWKFDKYDFYSVFY
jgi:hypothetical protein